MNGINELINKLIAAQYIDNVAIMVVAEHEIVDAYAKLETTNTELLEALKGLVECPSVKGMSAHIRDAAHQGGRSDEYAKALAIIAKAKKELEK